MSELAALRHLLEQALARVEALEAAERAQDTRQQQVDLLRAAAALLSGSRWSRVQQLGRLARSRLRSPRAPSTDVARLVDQALALGRLPTSAGRVWEMLLPVRRENGCATLAPSPPTGGSPWDD